MVHQVRVVALVDHVRGVRVVLGGVLLLLLSGMLLLLSGVGDDLLRRVLLLLHLRLHLHLHLRLVHLRFLQWVLIGR